MSENHSVLLQILVSIVAGNEDLGKPLNKELWLEDSADEVCTMQLTANSRVHHILPRTSYLLSDGLDFHS